MCEDCIHHKNYWSELLEKEQVEKIKSLEQECEELKKNVAHWKMEHKEAKAKGEWTYDLVKKRLGQQLDQLKKTNEELKNIIRTLQNK